jgi:hypothetical protein
VLPILGITFILMLGETSLTDSICVAVIREYLTNPTPYLCLFIFIFHVYSCLGGLLTNALCDLGGISADLANDTLYIKGLFTEVLIEELIGARLTILDLTHHIIIGFLSTQVLNGWLHIVILTEDLSLLSLVLKGALFLDNVCLSDHELSLSAIRH